MVEDGYLSENEGVEVEDVCDSSDGEEASCYGGALRHGMPDASALQQRQHLETLLDQSRRSTRPLYVSTLPATGPALPGDVAGVPHGWMAEESSLLGCLSMVLLDSGRQLTCPSGAAPPPPKATPRAPAPTTTPTTRGGEQPAERVEELRAFLRQRAQDPELKRIATLVDAFIEAHPGAKVTKKWVTTTVRSMAQYVHGAGWKLLDEGVEVAPAAVATPCAGAGVEEAYTTPHPVATLERFFGKVCFVCVVGVRTSVLTCILVGVSNACDDVVLLFFCLLFFSLLFFSSHN